MRFHNIFDVGSLRRRRTPPPVDGSISQGTPYSRDHFEEYGVSWVAASDGDPEGVGSGRSRGLSVSSRSGSKLSLLSLINRAGPTHSQATSTSSVIEAVEGGKTSISRHGESEHKNLFSTLGRKLTFRSSGTPKKTAWAPLSRSNTLPPWKYLRGNSEVLPQRQNPAARDEYLGEAIEREFLCGGRVDRGRNRNLEHSIAVRDAREATHTGTLIKQNQAEASSEQLSEAQLGHHDALVPFSNLSRKSSVSTLRQDDFDLPSHYLGASEVAALEMTSSNWSIVDLTCSNATPTISPYSSINSSSSRGMAHHPTHALHGSSIISGATNPIYPATPTKPSRQIPVVLPRSLNSLSSFLASFRETRTLRFPGSYKNFLSGLQEQKATTVPCDSPPVRSQYSPSVSVTSSSGSEGGQRSSGSSSDGRNTGSTGHSCPRCQVNFLTSNQLLEHWSVFHTYDVLQLTLSPLHHYGDKTEETLTRRRHKDTLVEDEVEHATRIKTKTPQAVDSPIIKVSRVN